MRNSKLRTGSILVTILFMMSILALLVAAVAKDSMQSMRSVAQSGRDTQARYAAHAGLELALNELRKFEMFVGEEEISERHGRLEGSMEGLEQINYEVLVWNNIQDRTDGEPSGDPEALEGPGDVLVRPDTVYLVSSGSDMSRGEEVLLSSMAGTARRVRPVFDDAAFARSKMALAGAETVVDAWDSSAGPGGFEAYSGGEMPSPDPSATPDPNSTSNVLNYEATLGTDTPDDRTLRLTNGAQLNGHYRLGPAIDEDRAFGSDVGHYDDGDVTYAVSTTDNDLNIAGLEPGTAGEITAKFQVDTKDTDVPHFASPFADEDVADPPTITGGRTRATDDDGEPASDDNDEPIYNYSAANTLAPGGYESVSVGPHQTLELSPGVYFFRDELSVQGGKITTVGDGPVIVFCGKKASFVNADINPDRSANSLQLCFTDDLTDPEQLGEVVDQVVDLFGNAGLPGNPLVTADVVAPRVSGSDDRKGFSFLEMTNSTVSGSISGERLVAVGEGSEIFGSLMGNVVKGQNLSIHQDVALKGSNLMTPGGWKIESVHQIR